MHRVLLVRALSLYVPLSAAMVLWQWKKPFSRELTGALLATAWNIPSLFAINLLAFRAHWWVFQVQGGAVEHIPVDLWLGWAALWGFIGALLFSRLPIWLGAISAIACDAIFMPLCTPVLALYKTWWIGEAAAILFCLIPGILLARWTAEQRFVKARAALQAVCFGSFFILASTLYLHAAGKFGWILDFGPLKLHLLATFIVLAAVPGLSAVQEFAIAGHGTPLPFDSPQRLVTSGIYTYIANPMQVSVPLILLVLAVFFRDLALLATAILALLYSIGLAAWDENLDLKNRFSNHYIEYREHVRDWIPRWQPYVPTSAKIYIAGNCGKCSEIGLFLRSLHPCGLEIVPAENHPTRDLSRMTYECNGMKAEGLAAFARALEHVNFAWAFAGMFLRLPGINQLLQAVVDASGGGPMIVQRAGSSAGEQGSSCGI